jgi:hypothetical protein
MNEHPARVTWLRPAPTSRHYIGLSRFKDDGPEWPDGSFSVVLRFSEPPAEQVRPRLMPATVQFMAEGAPHERLQPGVVFGLYEGLTHIADVEVAP